MARISLTSIAHCLGFGAVFVLSIYWFTTTAVSGPDRFLNKIHDLQFKNNQLENICTFSESLTKTISDVPNGQIIGYFRDISTQPIIAKEIALGNWSIDIYDEIAKTTTKVVSNIPFSGKNLTKTYQPIYNLIVFPSCSKTECNLITWSVADGHQVSSVAAIDSYSINRADIDNVFFDSDGALISYTTQSKDISERIVLSYEGRLLQSIDESPGVNRQLHFLGYSPQTKQLIYQDIQTKWRLGYAADTIHLSRYYCQ